MQTACALTSEPWSQNRVLIIDDDREMRQSLEQLLTATDWQVTTLANAANAKEALLTCQPDVVLCDLRMPGMGGLELLSDLQKVDSCPPIVLITAHGCVRTAVEAMETGAYSFIEKPFDPHELIGVLKKGAIAHTMRETDDLEGELSSLSAIDKAIVGRSEAAQMIRDDILSLKDITSPILLVGETGTGKDLVARTLHKESAQSHLPFAAANCATLETDLTVCTESGERVSIWDLLDEATGGTLYLNEVGHCADAAQNALLQILKEAEERKSGFRPPIRIIASSNVPLEELLTDGRFRNDLFFRLNAIPIALPPLRKRMEDVPDLLKQFLQDYTEHHDLKHPEICAEDLLTLLSYEWPGNIRELRHLAERKVIATRLGGAKVSDLLRCAHDGPAATDKLRPAVAVFERELISKALVKHSGRMDDVADSLGIGRRTLNEKIVRLNLDKSDLVK